MDNPRAVVSRWCRRGDSNPHGLPHTPLKRARLPVPPLRPADWSRTGAKYTLTSAPAKPSDALAQPRIERVANAFAEQVVGQHGDEDREPGIDGEPPRELDDFLAVVQNVAPRRVRRAHAEAEERQA